MPAPLQIKLAPILRSNSALFGVQRNEIPVFYSILPQRRGHKLNEGSGARQRHLLRAARRVVLDNDRAILVALVGRPKLDVDRATGLRIEAGRTIVAGQLLVSLNWLVDLILAISRVPVPVFVSITGCRALVVKTTCVGKVRLVGLKVTAAWVPTPVRDAFCGLLAAPSVMATAAFLAPVAFGLKVTH
jgi:hypothetical protein